jgi:uncharacterized membrane protein
MTFCGNCRTQVQDGVKFCPSCGKEIGASPAGQAQSVAPQQQYAQPQQQYQQPGQVAPQNDAQANKVMAILSYILFFIPLLTGDHKKSPFVKYHANQGVIVFILGVAYSIISAILSAIIKVDATNGWGAVVGVRVSYTPGWLTTILWIGSLAIFALAIYGIYNAVTGKMKPLPVVGDKITLIK